MGGVIIDSVAAQLIVFVGSLVVLAVVADGMVSAVLAIAKRFQIPGSIAGATMAAVATSAPELGTNVFALLAARGPDSVEATASIGTGTIFGSAIFNLAAVIGLAGLLYGMKLARRVVARDGLAYVGALVLLLTLVLIGGAGARTITRSKGAILLGLYLLFVLLMVTRTFFGFP